MIIVNMVAKPRPAMMVIDMLTLITTAIAISIRIRLFELIIVLQAPVE